MLGRRHYRIKVYQSLYSWFMGAETRPEIAEKNLFQSIDKIYELYYLQISLFLEVIHFYGIRQEEAKRKFLPTEEDLNPNYKFLDNLVVRQIMDNKNVQSQIQHYKISWTEEQEMVQKIFKKIRSSKEIKEYLSSAGSTYQQDQEIVYKIMKKFVARSPELQFYCDERSIYWTDDFHSVSMLVLKTIRMLSETFSDDTPFPTLFLNNPDEDSPEEDKKFIRELFRKTINQSEDYGKLIEAKTRNWELERIALTDILLLKMALTELIYFPSIPVKVTLNEYIEISKLFSTQKSKLFINGVLDKLVEELKGAGEIKKTGRGLMT